MFSHKNTFWTFLFLPVHTIKRTGEEKYFTVKLLRSLGLNRFPAALYLWQREIIETLIIAFHSFHDLLKNIVDERARAETK